nr:universal stress protein [Dissulfurirhabdus thermomarina]
MGSVTYGLVQQLHDLPLWLVDTPARSRRVLLALDNCEPCLKVVDHAAHMLAGIPGLELTILHVIPRFQPFFSKADTVALDALDSLSIRRAEATLRPLLERASGILREAGVDPGAVSIKVKRGGTSAYKEILTEFRGGGFGTLVVGRRGVGGWEALFPGSVSDRLLHGLRNGALWVVA